VRRMIDRSARFQQVQHPVRILAIAVLTVTACAAIQPGGASAAISWAPCGDSNVQACGHLTVPLDPTGAVPGAITLAMRRQRSPVGEAKDAVIALAGGPGQAAIPFTGQFADLLGPILWTRDLIAFDQRGTGLSHPLSCPAFEHLGSGGPSPGAVAICAGQIGEERDLYTTTQTVTDIEAIRRAGGYEKLVLYGTSYGTKVAEQYAQAYPSHVEALILDSVVTPEGPDALNLSTFAAIPRVLRALCAFKACAHITRDPVGELARLARRLRRHPLRVRKRHGAVRSVTIGAGDMLGILIEGDLDPRLRVALPAAVHAALAGDSGPLARLVTQAQGDAGSEPESLAEGFDAPLYFTTTCEETRFPFNLAATPAQRLHEALTSIHAAALKRAFAPFSAADAFVLGDIPICARWPYPHGAPSASSSPIPAVPTLILSGAEDLRTPISNALELAAEIPGAHLLVVPYAGHSVLASDPSGCAERALQALFAGRPIGACPNGPPPQFLRPTPLPHPPRHSSPAIP
jgi:pimeloyl-ACP methyl ester carboxylesterase